MSLREELTSKQKRIIARDINSISSMKGLAFPKTIEDIKELGFFSPKIIINDKEIYLSTQGETALRRICDIIHGCRRYRDLLNYNDIFQSLLAEFGRWLGDGKIPDTQEFIDPLDSLLSNSIKNFYFSCRVDGVALKNIESIQVGRRKIKNFSKSELDSATDISEEIKEAIVKEYEGGLVISGSENGSKSIALEKFYHNAELSLSVLRLYSCALFQQAIHKVNIRLINNCANAYGPASTFALREPDKSLLFTRYFKSIQEFEFASESLGYLRDELFFEELSSLIDNSSRTELEDAIVRSLYWIGEAQKDQSNPSAFVKLWSAVECFFSLAEAEITESNSRGITAILLFGGFNHEQYEDYDQLKKKIKGFYKLRSKVVHHAEFSHIDEIQLEEMAYIASWVVIVMVTLVKRGYTKLSEIKYQAKRLDKAQKGINNQSSPKDEKI
jgi:hypothetical protein